MRVALFIPSYGDGGVERDFVNTAYGLSGLGVEVDLVTDSTNHPYLDSLSEFATIITLGGDTRDSSSFRAFTDYLRSRRPHVLMSGKDEAHESALAGRAESGIHVPLIMRPGTIVSAKYRLSRFWRTVNTYRKMRKSYPKADLLVAVSQGVAHDTAMITGVDESAIEVIRSPVLTPKLYELAKAPVSHPWLGRNKQYPVLIAIGGLRRQKGFSDLLQAFAQARRSREMRLIIIGQGRLRQHLEIMVKKLNIAGAVDLAGFIENPYPLLAASDLFVLSSYWEGAPTVLTEALALGKKVVSTDCPGSPRETIGDNRYGILVPVADPEAMASAINASLRQPQPSPGKLRVAVEEYTLETSAARYHAVMERLVRQA